VSISKVSSMADIGVAEFADIACEAVVRGQP
jgi:hypothetical protein